MMKYLCTIRRSVKFQFSNVTFQVKFNVFTLAKRENTKSICPYWPADMDIYWISIDMQFTVADLYKSALSVCLSPVSQHTNTHELST